VTESDPGPTFAVTSECHDAATGGVISNGNATISVSLAAQEQVVCTFTNTDITV
jgi:hypothetical protein